MRRILSIIIMLTLFSVPLLAQPCDPLVDPYCDNESTDIPIDGGSSLLLLGAIAVGYKKIRDAKNLEIENKSTID